jgi:hypothetical protein
MIAKNTGTRMRTLIVEVILPHVGLSETQELPSTRKAQDEIEPSAAAIRAAASRNNSV